MPRLILTAYGRTIGVTGPTSALRYVRRRLPATFRVSDREPEREWAVRRRDSKWVAEVEGERLFVRPDVAAATEMMLSDLEVWVAERSVRSLFIHAGCAVVDGKAIVLPGRSKTGKSRLTAALVRAGAEYYSDEYAVLDHLGMVRPYPRPLVVREENETAPVRRTLQAPAGRTGRGPATVGLIAYLSYRPDAGFDVEPISRAQTILRLLDNAAAARSRPRSLLTAADRATCEARAIAGHRGDADQAASLIMDMMS